LLYLPSTSVATTVPKRKTHTRRDSPWETT
jgi:hypothetical protein